MLFLISEQEQKYRFRREQSQGHILVAAAEKREIKPSDTTTHDN